MITYQKMQANLRFRRSLGEDISMERINKVVDMAEQEGWNSEYKGEEKYKEVKLDLPDYAYYVY